MDGEKKQTFIEMVDPETRESILAFDHKLKAINAEITAKIASLTDLEDQQVMQQRLTMLHLQKDVYMALETVYKLINTPLSEEEDPQAFATLKDENLFGLRDAFKEKLELLEDMKDAFK